MELFISRAAHKALRLIFKPKESTNMAKPQVTDVDFVKACVNSKTAEAVASATGLKHSTVLSRAAKLRKAGVNLPEFDRAKKLFR
jgi:hypothetical protein